MSKLTPEQKAANKAAQKVRDMAFTERRRKYVKALDQAEKQAEESEFARLRDEAVAAVDREWRNRNQAMDAIKREIEQLNEKLERTRELYAMSLEPKKEARDSAVRAFHAHVKHLKDAVNEQHPGMDGCWYVSQWTIPADVQAEMVAALKTTASSEKVVAHI